MTRTSDIQRRGRQALLILLIALVVPGASDLYDRIIHPSVRLPEPRPLLRSITPIGSGPGLLVCDPDATGANPTTASFGNGCARWLQLTVGGQGALGKTSSWHCLLHAQRELGQTDLCVTRPQAASLARSLGVTYVAVGQIRGQEDQ